MPESDDGSYVTMAAHICAACGEVYETGDLLLDTRLRPTFKERRTVTAIAGPCPECQKKVSDGFIAVVGAKSQPGNPDRISHEAANPTGCTVWVRASVWDRIFDIPAPSEGMCYAEPAVVDELRRLAGNPEGSAEPDAPTP